MSKKTTVDGEIKPGAFHEEAPSNEAAKLFIEGLVSELEGRETEISFPTGIDLEKLAQAVEKLLKDPSSELSKKMAEENIHPEVIKLLKKRIEGKDFITELPRRETQTDRIREAIREARDSQAGLREGAKKIGFVSFDVRGLKMVNDLMKDHKYGDNYLLAVSNHIENDVLPTIKKALGEKVKISFARDGGDEFSLLLESEEMNLDDINFKVGDEKNFEIKSAIDKFIEEIDDGEQQNRFREFAGAGEKNLMQVINDFVNFRMAEETNNIIPKEKLQEFMRAGGDETDWPDDFELKFFVASGASTLSEIIENPQNEHFKQDLETDEKKPKTGKDMVDRLLGALRTKADEESYRVKSEQNKHWIESGDPYDQAMIKMISRNDVTISLARKAQFERRRAEELGEKVAATETRLRQSGEALDRCLQDKTRLEMGKK